MGDRNRSDLQTSHIMIAKMTVRMCAKQGEHSDRRIEAFCLEKGCRQDPLLCLFCVLESHQFHRIVYLSPAISGPLSNLQTQALLASKEPEPALIRLEGIFSQIMKACDRLGRLSNYRQRIIRKRLGPQIEALRLSFCRKPEEEIIHHLTSNRQLTSSKVEEFVSILDFYSRHTHIDLPRLERNSRHFLHHFSQMVSQANRKIEDIFNQMASQLSKFDLMAQEEPKEGAHCIPEFQKQALEGKIDDVLQEKIRQNMKILAEQQQIEEQAKIDMIFEPQEPQEESGINERQNKIDPEKSSQHSANTIQAALSSKRLKMTKKRREQSQAANKDVAAELQGPKKKKKLQKQKKKQGINPELAICIGDSVQQQGQEKKSWQKDIIWGELSNVVSHTNSFQLQQTHVQPEHQLDHPIKKEQPQVPKQVAPQPHHVPVEVVHIYATTCEQLCCILKDINVRDVRKLTIRCDTRLTVLSKHSIETISRMVNLTSLKVYLAKGITEQQAITMILPLQELRELVLAEFSDASEALMTSIKTYNRKLSRIVFSSDMEEIGASEEVMEFLPDIPEALRDESLWESLIDSGMILSTLQLQDSINHVYWINYVRRCGDQLREVAITQTNRNTVDSTHLLEALAKCTRLECLRLENLEFQESALIRLIKNNPNLKVFVISEIQCIRYVVFETLFRHAKKLKCLSISIQNVFTAHLGHLCTTLEVLILRGCYKVVEAEFCSMLKGMRNLRCISINYAQWLGRDALWEICQMKSLSVVNLSNNPTCLRLFNLDQIDFDIFICTNNHSNDYKKLTDHYLAKKLLSQPNDRFSFKALAEPFCRLTHLKLLNYQTFAGEVRHINLPRSLVSLVMGGCGRDFVSLMREYCAERKISFYAMEDAVPN